MGRTCSLMICDSTRPKHIDLFFNSVWGRYDEPVNLELNTVHCNNISLRRILSMKKYWIIIDQTLVSMWKVARS